MSPRRRVVAAIDFGTYGSGFAWATVSRENDDLFDRKVKHFLQWKDQRTVYAKNRSAVLIGADGELVAWGHEALRLKYEGNGTAGTLHRGFKMDLQTDLGDGLGGDGLGAAGPGGDGRPGVRSRRETYQLIVRCLREVFKTACAEIVQGLYRESDIRWCVTIPAIWDSYTADLMYQAAVEAGLPSDPERLLLAREPAAAALHCLATGEDRLGENGTRFMLVDAGGGTVDIASYEVRSRGQLSQLVEPDGAKCGSEFLNDRFMELELSREFGPDGLAWIKSEYRQQLSVLMDAFEREKLSFGAGSADGLRLELGPALYGALRRRREDTGRGPEPRPVLVCDRDKVTGLFESLLDEVLPKVDAQLTAMRAASGQRGGEIIALVGGFAQSPYLRARLGDHVAGLGAELIVPRRPELAVLSGAVHFAYNPEAFLSWPSPLTYGVRRSEKFRPGIDPESSRFIAADGSAWCGDRFSVFVAIGQEVTAGKTVTRKYAPIDETAPRLVVRLLTSHQPHLCFASDPGVVEAGQIVVDLTASIGQPVAARAVELTLKFLQTRIVATARSLHTGEATSIPIHWRPTW